MNPILSCSQLNKRFGTIHAVRQLQLELEEDKIYALLGRNGAGKTTLLHMIAGGISPDSGEIILSGQILKKGDIPRHLCYVREKHLFFRSAKIIETLQLASSFYEHWDWSFAHELLTRFKLNPDMKIKQLSRGMESLVGNIIGLASRAPVTIFDEPVLGLDVMMRDHFYRMLMKDYADHPRTILVSTHLIDEIAPVAEEVYIMDNGSVILHDEVDHIRTRSYLIRGNQEAVWQFTESKRVIHQETYGNGMMAAVYDLIEEEERTWAARQGISIEGLPLQQFFAYLIEGSTIHA
ncbi:ATP-binding cassette domain-containing protein [Paenibacillus sp. Z6-24]